MMRGVIVDEMGFPIRDEPKPPRRVERVEPMRYRDPRAHWRRFFERIPVDWTPLSDLMGQESAAHRRKKARRLLKEWQEFGFIESRVVKSPRSGNQRREYRRTIFLGGEHAE